MHLTKNQIITELFQSKEFNECINKMDPDHLRDDLRSEVMLILCEKSEDEIISLQAEGRLRFYTVRIILNLIQSSTSPFYKKYRQQHAEYVETGEAVEDLKTKLIEHYEEQQSREIDIRLIREMKEDEVMAAINQLYWYDKEVILLYMKHGNYRAIETETGIPWESTYNTIQKAFKKIRQRVQLTTP